MALGWLVAGIRLKRAPQALLNVHVQMCIIFMVQRNNRLSQSIITMIYNGVVV